MIKTKGSRTPTTEKTIKAHRISIFHTGDIHGRDEQSAKLFSLYKRLRSDAEARGHSALFLDGGDASDRRLQYCSVTQCAAYSHVMNAFGYDAAVVGNDIGLVYGMDALEKACDRLTFPTLGANLTRRDGSLQPGIADSILLDREGIRIGIFGLTSPWGNLYESWDLSPRPYVETAKDESRRLKKAGAEIIVQLSHLGLQGDMDVAWKVDGIDVVCGAHSHVTTPSGIVSSNGLVVNHTGEYARNLGRIDIDFDLDGRRVLAVAASTIEVSEGEVPAREIMTAIRHAKSESEELERIEIGELEYELELDYESSCSMGDFAARALKQFFNADGAILATGTLHSGLNAGIVTFGDLNRACFTPVNPVVSEMNGSAIIAALERGSDLDLVGYRHHGLRGSPIGVPQLAGISVEPGVNQSLRTRYLIGGDDIDLKKRYRIAHTDLEPNKRYGYFSQDGHVELERRTDLILRDVLESYLSGRSDAGPDVQDFENGRPN